MIVIYKKIDGIYKIHFKKKIIIGDSKKASSRVPTYLKKNFKFFSFIPEIYFFLIWGCLRTPTCPQASRDTW